MVRHIWQHWYSCLKIVYWGTIIFCIEYFTWKISSASTWPYCFQHFRHSAGRITIITIWPNCCKAIWTGVTTNHKYPLAGDDDDDSCNTTGTHNSTQLKDIPLATGCCPFFTIAMNSMQCARAIRKWKYFSKVHTIRWSIGWDKGIIDW